MRPGELDGIQLRHGKDDPNIPIPPDPTIDALHTRHHFAYCKSGRIVE